MNTHSLRQQKILARDTLSNCQQHANAQQLCLRIMRTRTYKKAKHIGLYFAQHGEINLEPLIRQAFKAGKEVYVPVILPKFTMRFARFTTRARLTKNRYGIPEPAIKQFVPISKLELILCPLVAFDTKGRRIGMGGGFYDRTLAQLKCKKRTAVWGVAHELQRCTSITAAPWDVSMQKIATEKRIYSAINVGD